MSYTQVLRTQLAPASVETRIDGQIPAGHFLAMVAALVTGVLLSVWLAIDPPLQAPVHPSYLPGN